MGAKITVDQDTLLSLISNFSFGDDDPDFTNGTLNPKGPGGPVMFGQVVTRQFVTAIVTNEQANTLREGKFTAGAASRVIAEFADDICGNGVPHRFPPLPWPPTPPIRPDTLTINQLASAVELYKAAQALQGTELHAPLSDAAGKIAAVALKGMG